MACDDLVSPGVGFLHEQETIGNNVRNYKRQKEAPVGAAHVSCVRKITDSTEEVAEGELIKMLGPWW